VIKEDAIFQSYELPKDKDIKLKKRKKERDFSNY
jgi:hypothetical protein